MKEKSEPIIKSKIANQNIQSPNSYSLTETLKALYRSQDKLPKLIEDKKIKAQSLEDYYVKLQMLLSGDDDADKVALRDKVAGEKQKIEIENIFKVLDQEKKIRELLSKELTNNDEKEQEEKIDSIIKPPKNGIP